MTTLLNWMLKLEWLLDEIIYIDIDIYIFFQHYSYHSKILELFIHLGYSKMKYSVP